jgi:ABC-type nitrate/sulfonate/bicarbonate transport system substrate-binding protein
MLSWPKSIVGAVCAAFLAVAAPLAAAPLEELPMGLGSGSLVGGSARIAKELGLFEKHGFDARLVVMDNGSAAAAGMAGGSFRVVVCGPADLISLRAHGQDVLAVEPTYVGLGVNLILDKALAAKLGVSPSAPVQERLKALDGLVIGTTSPTTVATVSLKQAAEAAGAKIRFAYLTQPAFFAALQTGAIQGHIGGAPFWAPSIIQGVGIQWINGSKGEFPPQFAPGISSLLATRADVAKSDPDFVRRVAAVFVDLGRAVKEHPPDVKAAIAKLYPAFDAKTIDLLFDSEAGAWVTAPITAQQIAHEIVMLKATGAAPSDVDKIDPASMVFR